MPKISVYRKSGWMTRFKVVELYLDGERIGYLSNGETKEFDVPVGQHTLKAKMGWYGSKNLDCTVYNKESKSYTLSPNYIPVSLHIFVILCIVLIQNYLKNVHKLSHSYIWLFPALILLIVGSYQIIGRNNYLIIKEDGQVEQKRY
jgi:hypothetical protein